MEITMADKIVKTSEKVDETPVQKLARLDAERAEILASAKADALQKATDAVSELNALGFQYRLTEEAEKKLTVNHAPSDKPCTICGFKTEPFHDARSHPRIGEKKPFTAEELTTRKLVKV